jgi:hypothetical protein
VSTANQLSYLICHAQGHDLIKKAINGLLVKHHWLVMHFSQDIKQIQFKTLNNIYIELSLKSDNGITICSEIHKHISFVWKKEELSEECRKSVIAHIYNKVGNVCIM